MRTSTHFDLNLVEGTDKVNPLVQDVPNYEAIDDAMFDNKRSSIGIATELRTGTVHALVRQNEDAPMFRFTATSNYASGDTFTVDGVQVSALLVDGTPLPNMAYIIGSEVLCVLKGTLMTVFANRTTSSDSDRLGGELPSHYATDSDLDALEGVVDAHTNQITQLNSDLSIKMPEIVWANPSTQSGTSNSFIIADLFVVSVVYKLSSSRPSGAICKFQLNGTDVDIIGTYYGYTRGTSTDDMYSIYVSPNDDYLKSSTDMPAGTYYLTLIAQVSV